MISKKLLKQKALEETIEKCNEYLALIDTDDKFNHDYKAEILTFILTVQKNILEVISKSLKKRKSKNKDKLGLYS